jgi:SnoaL-like domain
MTFDPMASAIDWLDAYRAADIEAILKLFADDAVVECRCAGVATITGRESLRVYWQQQLKDYPASHLDDLQPSNDGATISYRSHNGVLGAALEFDPAGKIKLLQFGHLNPTGSK